MELPSELDSFFGNLPPILKWAITFGFAGAGAVLYSIERWKRKPAAAQLPANSPANEVVAAMKATEARMEAAEADANRLRTEAMIEDLKQDIFSEIGRTRQMFRDTCAPLAVDITSIKADLRLVLERLGRARR